MSRAASETIQLKVRMKEPLRARIEEAAKKRGVSMNVEAVNRLESSFANEGRVADEFGGQEKYQIFRMLSVAAETVESRTGNSWLADEGTATAVNFVWQYLVSQLLPGLPPEKVAENIAKDEPLVSIPNMPERPVHPLSGTLASRLSNMSGDDGEQARNELDEANVIHNNALIEHQKKLAKIEAALDENRNIMERRRKLINEWNERSFSSISEAISNAQPLFPPRR